MISLMKRRFFLFEMKKSVKAAAFIFIYLVVGCLMIEAIIRTGLFSKHFRLAWLRNASFYAGYSEDDDYWKLYYRFAGEFKPPSPKAIHPLLGWSQVWIEKDNPLGIDQEGLGLMLSDKIKILFYGDSYVRGIVSSPRYEIPKYMTKYLRHAVVVDLSSGGYGLDQMFLFFNLTRKRIQQAHVIFGILIEDDLDRSVLSVRTGQKPYFILRDNRLLLQGIPIDPDPQHYFATNPPQIKSYLFRFILQGLSRKTHFFEVHLKKIREKIIINAKIIEAIDFACKKENSPLLFVLFHQNPQITIWQEIFLKKKLEELRLPYLDTRDFLLAYASEHRTNLNNFYVTEGPGRGHHNDLGNEVIAQGILRYLAATYNLK